MIELSVFCNRAQLNCLQYCPGFKWRKANWSLKNRALDSVEGSIYLCAVHFSIDAVTVVALLLPMAAMGKL